MEQKIVREEQIMVVVANPNDFGDLMVKDSNGKEHKIAGKRKNLWELFKVGNQVTLKFGNYMNRDFVADAVLTMKSASTPAKTDNPQPEKPTISGPEHGMAMKLIGDLWIAGKLQDTNPLVTKTLSELHRIMGTSR